MAKKFGANKESGYFEIDPRHVSAGLAAAKVAKQSAIRITALDYRSDHLEFDADELAAHRWIRRLSLDEDLKPRNFSAVQALTGLTQLATNEWSPLDFSTFKRLKELTLDRGTALVGLEQVRSLRSLFLNDWRAAELPAATSALTATSVILGASNKLIDITPALNMPRLTDLNLTKLTKLKVDGPARLHGLKVLHVEDVVGWTDFSNLRSVSLQELTLFTKAASLGFLSQLPVLRALSFWDVRDGDMAPILSHPSLREVHFEPHKKHYTHTEATLNAHLRRNRTRPTRRA